MVLVPVRASPPVPGALRVFLQLPDQHQGSLPTTTSGRAPRAVWLGHNKTLSDANPEDAQLNRVVARAPAQGAEGEAVRGPARHRQ